MITDGSLLLDKETLIVEYTHAMGRLEGIREAILTIKHIKDLARDE